MNHNCKYKNEEEQSSKPAKNKIFKRQDPTSSEIETIPVDSIVPEIRKKDDQFKRQPSLPVETNDSENTDIKSNYLVKSEDISRRLVLREPNFEASDPVDDVGDSL